jgi:hypothetical protein
MADTPKLRKADGDLPVVVNRRVIVAKHTLVPRDAGVVRRVCLRKTGDDNELHLLVNSRLL